MGAKVVIAIHGEVDCRPISSFDGRRELCGERRLSGRRDAVNGYSSGMTQAPSRRDRSQVFDDLLARN
jgi:hypothetical protein